MQTQSNIDNITALFTTQPRDMPPISTATEAPSYTSLEAFKDKLDVNAMNIPSWSTNLGHLYLTIKTADFTKANGSAVIDPKDPGNIATAPTPVVRVATRSAIAAAAAAGVLHLRALGGERDAGSAGLHRPLAHPRTCALRRQTHLGCAYETL